MRDVAGGGRTPDGMERRVGRAAEPDSRPALDEDQTRGRPAKPKTERAIPIA